MEFNDKVVVNRVLEIDTLTSREKDHVKIRAKKVRENKDEEAPEFHYSPIKDIMALQHAIVALIFKCEEDGIAKKGELFKILIDTFKDMYIDVELHDSVEIEVISGGKEE